MAAGPILITARQPLIPANRFGAPKRIVRVALPKPIAFAQSEPATTNSGICGNDLNSIHLNAVPSGLAWSPWAIA